MNQPWTLDEAVAYGCDLLRGTHVSLRESREEDFARLTRWWADPSVAILQTNYVRPTPAATVSDMMRGWSSNVGSDVGFTIVMNAGSRAGGADTDAADADEHDPDGQDPDEHDTDEQRVIGQLNLFGVTKNRCATLGVVIGQEYWGKGFGTEAVRLGVRYGFAEMGLHRIHLGVYAYNERAIKSYASLGFVEEGRRREVALHGGRWHDEVLMAVLSDE
jgi:RimJ/RimL family protein N-acetyltransferase